MARHDANRGDFYYDNSVSLYDIDIYRWGDRYYAENDKGDRVVNGVTDFGLCLTTTDNLYPSYTAHLKNGTYVATTQVSIHDNVRLVGQDKWRTVIQTNMSSTFLTNETTTGSTGNNYISLENLQIDHSASSGGACINFTNVKNSSITNCVFRGNAASFTVFWTGNSAVSSYADYNHFNNNILYGYTGAAQDTFGGGMFRYSQCNDNLVIGGAGSAGIANTIPTYSQFNRNIIINSESSGINLESADHCQAAENICYNYNTNGVVLTWRNDNGPPSYCEVLGNICILGTGSSAHGIQIEGIGHVINDNMVMEQQSTGIVLTSLNTQTSSCQVSDNFIQNVGKNTGLGATLRAGIRLDSQNCIVTSNRIRDDQTPITTLYGIEEETGANVNIISGNNILVTGITAAIVQVGAGTLIDRNIGYVTEAQGTGTINSGATSATITHGLSYTPNRAEITITLGEDPTNTPGAIWVDTIGATQFKVNCENDPGASNLDFSWAVRKI